MKKNMRTDHAWLSAMADLEDSCPSISVGGLASDLGMLAGAAGSPQHVRCKPIEHARRAKGLSTEPTGETGRHRLGENPRHRKG